MSAACAAMSCPEPDIEPLLLQSPRRSSVLTNKTMLTSHKSVPKPCPGPAEARALNGGYCVHPAPDAPPGTMKAAIKTKNETKAVQKPTEVSLGKAMFDAPSCKGRKNVPKPACGTV